MPRIKRWFPVSHDINADPEVWAMRYEFGESILSVWLQILSVADRNEGLMKGNLAGWTNTLLRLYSSGNPRWIRRDSERLQSALRAMSEKGWISLRSSSDGYQKPVREGSEDALVVVNFWKYHRTPEHKQVPSEPSEPSEPNQTEPIKNKTPVKRATQYPEDFKPSETAIRIGEENALDIPYQLVAFRDFHTAKGSRFLDWQAAFRTWLRNAKKYNRNGNQTKADIQRQRTKEFLEVQLERGSIQTGLGESYQRVSKQLKQSHD